MGHYIQALLTFDIINLYLCFYGADDFFAQNSFLFNVLHI